MTRFVSDRTYRSVRILAALGFAAAVIAGSVGAVSAHGDVVPQAIDTTGLDPVGTEWLKENPYRLKGGEQYQKAIEIGTHGFAANCARCHGLQVISGGIAPDIRYLEDGKEGDTWFINRIRHGYSQNGAYKMPPFEGILSQEAMWAIRSYIETREK